MVRTYLSASEQSREDAWLDLVEHGVSTTAEIARAVGLTRRRIQQRIAAARARRQLERECDAELKHDGAELPWVELVDGTEPDHPHYDMRSDRLTKSPGAFRIGDHHGRRLRVQHAGNGKPVEKPAKSKAKFKPKGA